MSGWRMTSVEEFCPFIYGKGLPKMKRRSGKFGVYSSAGLIGSHSEPYTETAGIVIGRKGTVGSVHLSKEPFWPIDTAFYVLDEPQKRDLLFTFYRLSTLGLSQMNSDSAVPGLNRENAHAIEFLVPPLAEQREIAATLGALDNKIELNRRMSATLEEMARSLYRSWFVDFDPVHAKLEGRQPAFMDEETAALFPDRFGEDGLPEGWTLGCLSDVAINPRTGVKPDQIDPSTPYIGLEHMPKRSVVLGEWGTAEDIGSQKSAVRQGDFLFGKLRPYFHKVGISPVDGICSTDIVVVRAKRPEWAGFVLSVISSDAFVEHTNAGSSGTRMPRTNWGDMGRFEVIQPSVEVAEAFEGLLGIVRKQIIAGVHETKTLATLRDSLLPKLMSGELRVGEAREQIKEHA